MAAISNLDYVGIGAERDLIIDRSHVGEISELIDIDLERELPSLLYALFCPNGPPPAIWALQLTSEAANTSHRYHR